MNALIKQIQNQYSREANLQILRENLLIRGHLTEEEAEWLLNPEDEPPQDPQWTTTIKEDPELIPWNHPVLARKETGGWAVRVFPPGDTVRRDQIVAWCELPRGTP